MAVNDLRSTAVAPCEPSRAHPRGHPLRRAPGYKREGHYVMRAALATTARAAAGTAFPSEAAPSLSAGPLYRSSSSSGSGTADAFVSSSSYLRVDGDMCEWAMRSMDGGWCALRDGVGIDGDLWRLQGRRLDESEVGVAAAPGWKGGCQARRGRAQACV